MKSIVSFHDRISPGRTRGRRNLAGIGLILCLGFEIVCADLVFTVNSVNDNGDNNPGDGTCADASGNCTFRAAIEEANASGGVDTIRFDISPAGTHTIQPASALPVILDTVYIDGNSQPGFSGTPIIELDGSNAGTDANGLEISYSYCYIRGLVINSFDGSGIAINVARHTKVRGCYIGTDVAGLAAKPNNICGVWILGSDNRIGGTSASERNVISGNNDYGIYLFQTDTTYDNRIYGNYIGTDASGTQAIPNRIGIFISDARKTDIGGSVSGESNLISGNLEEGVLITGAGSTYNRIHGNSIGVDIAGDPLGNQGSGVRFDIEAGTYPDTNSVGGPSLSLGNTIANNGVDGVTVMGGICNSILTNSMYSNAQYGIELGMDGPTANDAGDPDEGANCLQNFPDIHAADIDGNGDLAVEYTVDSDLWYSGCDGCSKYDLTIQFFKADPNGQGEEWLGDDTYTDPGTAEIFLLVNAIGLGVAVGDYIVATATDSGNNTSEFSPPFTIGSVSVSESDHSVPQKFALHQNHPNPFNPVSTIRYDLPKAYAVSLVVYDILGREVTRLVEGYQEAGYHQAIWDGRNSSGRDVPSGIYLARLVTAEYSESIKMLLLK